MKVAVITDAAIIQGFAEGLHSIRSASVPLWEGPSVLIPVSVDVALGDECRRPSRANYSPRCKTGIERHDPN